MPRQSRADQSDIKPARSQPQAEVKGSGKAVTVAEQAAATRELLAATREKRRQESDPLFLATKLYGEAKEASRKSRGPKQTREERAVLRTQLYTAVKSQVLQEEREDEERAGEAMRQAIILRAQVGRPTDWNPILGESCCAWVSDGRSLRAWCRQTGIAPMSVWGWMGQGRRLDSGELFSDAFRTAHETRGPDMLADDVLRLPDEAMAAGNLTMPQVKLIELQVGVRQWIAARLNQRRWGDKNVDQGTQAPIHISIGIPAKADLAVVEQVQPTAVTVSR